MGYKTKSMINAKGAYAGGNEDPMYDSAAYLKTNLTDAGKSLGKFAGAYYSEDVRKPRLEKRAKKLEAKSDAKSAKATKLRERSKRLYGEEEETPLPVENATFDVKDRKGINTPTESNPVVDAIMKRTQPFSSLNQEKEEENEFKTDGGFLAAKNIMKSLNGGFIGGLNMMGDGFSKGMSRKNKYKK